MVLKIVFNDEVKWWLSTKNLPSDSVDFISYTGYNSTASIC